MSECPQGTCQNIKDLDDKIDKKTSELHEKTNDRVSKNTAKWAIGILITILILYGGAIVLAKVDIAEVKTHYTHIQESLKNIDSTNKAIWRVIREMEK